jgi:hypothetical protein
MHHATFAQNKIYSEVIINRLQVSAPGCHHQGVIIITIIIIIIIIIIIVFVCFRVLIF